MITIGSVKSLCYCLICLALFVSFASGLSLAGTAPATAWEKNYGESSYEEKGESVWQTSDNGFIIAGKTTSTSRSLTQIMLVKTDWQGNLQWSKTYPDGDMGNFVRQTSDGGYIATGSDGGNLYVLKTDENGNKQWSKTYPRPNNCAFFGYSVHQLPDGGYIVAGNINKGGDQGLDMYLTRIDSMGNQLWEKTYAGFTGVKQGGDDECYSVWPTSDGSFILGGFSTAKTLSSSGSVTKVDLKATLVKVDSDGNQQWFKAYSDIDGRHDGASIDVQQTRDGGYIWSGPWGGKMMLIKADANGNLQWHQIYDSYGQIYSVQQTWDDGYVFTGGKAAFPNETIVIRTDSQGRELWRKNLKGASISFSPSVQQIGNGSYVVAGMTRADAKAQPDVYLAQLDKDMTPVPNAKLVSDSIPYVMEAGKAYSVQVTFENTGTMPWTYQDNTTFGHHGDSAKFGVVGANQTIQIGKVVRPGQSETFSFIMMAPGENGTYNPRFQMMWEGHNPFGTLDNKTIWIVNGTGPAVSPPATAPAFAVEIGTTTSQATTPGAATHSQPTAAPTSAAPTKGTGGIPCLSSLLLPLIAVGMITVRLAVSGKRGNK